MATIEALTIKLKQELSEMEINQIRERVSSWHIWQKASTKERKSLVSPIQSEAKWLVKLKGTDSDSDYEAANGLIQRTGGKIKLADFGAEELGHRVEFYYIGPFEDEKAAWAFQQEVEHKSAKIEGKKLKKANKLLKAQKKPNK